MQKRGFTWKLVTILVFMLFLVAACSSGSTPAPNEGAAEPPAAATEPAAAEPDEMEPFEVVMGIAANVGELHPNLTSLTTDWIVLEQVMDPLIVLGPDGTFQPWLATGWDVSEDGLVWTFKLREGVKFHNGEDFNAEAVKFTFEDALSVEGSSQTTVINELSSINVIDEYTVETVTARPNPIWLSQIAHIFIMPPEYSKEVGTAGFNEAPVGTGAFVFVEWVKDDHVTVDKNPDWWNGEPKVDRVTFRTIPEASARVASIQAGETDKIGRAHV